MDAAARRVWLADGGAVSYDRLVLATGLKTIANARAIRSRLITDEPPCAATPSRDPPAA